MAFPSYIQPKDRVLASLAARFDDSNSHPDGKAITVGGYLAHESRWNAFIPEWQAFLKRCGLTEPWHQNKFAAVWDGKTPYDKNKNPYADWSLEECTARFKEAALIINRHVEVAIAVTVDRDLFKQATTKEAKTKCGDEYGLAVLACVREAARIGEHLFPGSRIACQFETKQGANEAKGFVTDFSLYSGWSVEIGDAGSETKRFPPLQAADILAWEWYRDSERYFGRDPRPRREALKLLGDAPDGPRLALWRMAGDEIAMWSTMLSAWGLTPYGKQKSDEPRPEPPPLPERFKPQGVVIDLTGRERS